MFRSSPFLFHTVHRALGGVFCIALLQVSTVQAQGTESGAGPGVKSGIHAGWQTGPVALHTERNRAFGVHNLGNAGYGHTLTVQSAWKGPWEIELSASRSTVTADDGGIHGMQTEVQSGAVMVNWVWDAAGQRRDAQTRFASVSRGFQPFVGVGIAHVDHVLKQDLEDAFGRTYHLWTDGTLRDRDEAGDHGGQALILRRDYTYESDLPSATELGSGRSIAIPAQVGIRLDVSPRIRARMGIGGWLGMSDRVDDQESGTFLSGDALATGFFGLGIRLGQLGKKAVRPEIPEGMSMEDAALLASMDTDGDGVNNLIDRCPGTRGIPVDANGCPLDSDGDGYADHRDAEPHSRHTRVDANGVALRPGAPDSTGADRFLTPQDGWDTVRGTVTSDDRSGYTLAVAAPASGWTRAEQNMIMAFQHVSEADGGVRIDVGTDPLEAGRAAHTMRTAGLDADLIAPEAVHGTLTEAHRATDSGTTSSGHYRVQLGAYRTPDPSALNALFDGMEVVRFQGGDGLTRVVSPEFTLKSEAIAYKVRMVALGFTGAFITAHGLPADAQPMEPAQGLTEAAQSEEMPQFNPDKIAFRIQLGALRSRMSVEALDGLLDLGHIEHRSTTGWHRYLHGDFRTAESAHAALAAVQERGFPDAFVVGDVAGRVVPIAEALILLRQD